MSDNFIVVQKKTSSSKFKLKETLPLPSDAEVKLLVDTWDIVRCAICHKKTSMLTARMNHSQSKFFCKKCCGVN